MSLSKKAFKEGTWLGLFKLISQSFSWVSTIIIANILVPDDYGLMALATIISMYASIFSELGFGAAIVQRQEITEDELSSLFWFTILTSLLFSVACYWLSYPTAFIFNEPRVIPITKVISILFIINGMQIVPLNLLRKEIKFKLLGLIELVSIIVSCGFMILIAYMGGGVWTLVFGRIILSTTKLGIVYLITSWHPHFHFIFKEIKPFLKFGIKVAGGRTIFYLYENSDKFVIGKYLSAGDLGLYSFAMNLSSIPTDKIVSLIRQVSFPVLSKVQNNKIQFRKYYLNILKIVATVTFPLFVGGYLLGESLIIILLDEKWFQIIFLFKNFCLIQIVVALLSINNIVHISQGRPEWTLYFGIVRVVVMPVSYYIAVGYGLNAMLIPWATTYIIISVIWILVTLRKIGISFTKYLEMLKNPFFSTCAMAISIYVCQHIVNSAFGENERHMILSLITMVLVGLFVYISYYWIFDRQIFYEIKYLIKD